MMYLGILARWIEFFTGSIENFGITHDYSEGGQDASGSERYKLASKFSLNKWPYHGETFHPHQNKGQVDT